MKLLPELVLPFFYGTLLGSFFNVCIFRIPRGTSILSPGSSCPVCKETLRWWQNIPLWSYLLLGGKCANCGSGIPFRYVVVELISGFLLSFLWVKNGFLLSPLFLCELTFVSLLLILSFIDWDFQIIPDKISYPGIAAGFLCSFLHHRIAEALFAALLGVLFFYSIRVVGQFVFLKEAMGIGDVKLAGMLGAFLGIHGLALAVVLSFPVGTVMALGLILSGLKGRKDYIPFGPSMALSGFTAYFFGPQLLSWYLNH